MSDSTAIASVASSMGPARRTDSAYHCDGGSLPGGIGASNSVS